MTSAESNLWRPRKHLQTPKILEIYFKAGSYKHLVNLFTVAHVHCDFHSDIARDLLDDVSRHVSCALFRLALSVEITRVKPQQHVTCL